MQRFKSVSALCGLLLLCAAFGTQFFVLTSEGAAATAQVPIVIGGADISKAPLIVLSVSVAGGIAERESSKFRILESGTPRAATVVNLPADPIQVSLIIDTSGSMTGSGLAGAKSAATQLISRLPTGAAVEVIGFGNTPYVASNFTIDRAATKAAIGSLTAAGETALNDAVILAAQSFTNNRRTIVLLTDGRDTTSSATTDQAAKVATLSGALVYGVVLDTPDSDLVAPTAFASSSGGRVVSARSPSDLDSIFSSIGGELSSQFRLSFIAKGSGSTGLVVQVRQANKILGRGETRVTLPASPSEDGAKVALPDPVTPPGVETKAPEGFTNSWAAVVVGAVCIAIGIGFLALLATRRKPSESQLSGAGERFMPRRSPSALLADLRGGVTLLTEQALKRSTRSAGLDKALENAGIEMRAGEYALTVLGLTLSAFLLGIVIGDLFIAIFLAVVVAVLMQLRLSRRARKRQDAFSDQLEQTLPLLAGTLRAGFSILQAIDAVARESESPTSDEFGRIVIETRLGRDLDDSLNEVALRVSNDDFRWVVQAIQIHRLVGGDLAEILDKVSQTIRDRNSARRQVQALSAEGRLSAIVLFIMPFGTAFFIQLVNPGYLGELFNTTAGILMLIGGFVLLSIGGIWTKKIIQVEY